MGEEMMDAQKLIADECDNIKAILLEKNKAYGNSALEPVRVFSKADTVEQIRVRLDDKLSRMMRGGQYAGEDTELDLIGYLVLLRVAKKISNSSEHNGCCQGHILEQGTPWIITTAELNNGKAGQVIRPCKGGKK